ncbi:hypothetical protein PFISCL1PPCAC_1542, partial [Pristionchus fissidentatus]
KIVSGNLHILHKDAADCPTDAASTALAAAATEAPTMTITSLPYDVFHKIAPLLSDKDRARLEQSSSQFRKFGQRFGSKVYQNVRLELTRDVFSILLRSTARHQDALLLTGDQKDADELCGHLLWNATISVMEVRCVDVSETCIEDIPVLLSTAKFDTLDVRFHGSEENAIKFIPELINGRNLAMCIVILRMNIDCKQGPDNFRKEVLQQLPMMHEINFEWTSIGEDSWDKYPVDDDTMFHVINVSMQANLGKGNFTAQGLLNAFEIVRREQIDGNKKHFESIASKAVIEEMMGLDSHKYSRRSIHPHHIINDSVTGTGLYATTTSTTCEDAYHVIIQ